jgi:hypothetical protein
MSRRKPLILGINGSPEWAMHVQRFDGWLKAMQEEPGPWTDDLIRDTRGGGYHGHNFRHVGRGAMRAEAGLETYITKLTIEPMIGNRKDGSLSVPCGLRHLPEPHRAIAHARSVLATLLKGTATTEWEPLVASWSRGIAGIAASLGAKEPQIVLPSGFVPIEVHDGEDAYASIPTRTRRRISTACPRILIIHAANSPEGVQGMPSIDAVPFMRIFSAEGDPGTRCLSSDPIGVMRDVAMVMDAAGIVQEDLRA